MKEWGRIVQKQVLLVTFGYYIWGSVHTQRSGVSTGVLWSVPRVKRFWEPCVYMISRSVLKRWRSSSTSFCKHSCASVCKQQQQQTRLNGNRNLACFCGSDTAPPMVPVHILQHCQCWCVCPCRRTMHKTVLFAFFTVQPLGTVA